jgi:hypothetical protein
MPVFVAQFHNCIRATSRCVKLIRSKLEFDESGCHSFDREITSFIESMQLDANDRPYERRPRPSPYDADLVEHYPL